MTTWEHWPHLSPSASSSGYHVTVADTSPAPWQSGLPPHPPPPAPPRGARGRTVRPPPLHSSSSYTPLELPTCMVLPNSNLVHLEKWFNSIGSDVRQHTVIPQGLRTSSSRHKGCKLNTTLNKPADTPSCTDQLNIPQRKRHQSPAPTEYI